MFANFGQIVTNDPVVTALIGTSPTRFWPFASSPQKGQAGYGVPYGVFQSVYGTPENYLNELPDIDNLGVQVDSYGLTASSARAVAKALRNSLEPHGHVVSYNGEERDSETGLYRVGFTIELWQQH